MTLPTYETLTTDLGKYLRDAGVGQWNDSGIYTVTTPPPIFWGIIPDTAGYAIGLNVYHDMPTDDDVTREFRVQIMARGDRHPGSPDQILNRVYTALHNKSHFTLNNQTHVLLCRRVIRTSSERDANKMWSRADSYMFILTAKER